MDDNGFLNGQNENKNEENERNENKSEENDNKKGIILEDHKNESNMKGFIWGFLITLIPYMAMFFYFKMYDGLGIISAFFLSILFMIIGIILWAVIKLRFKNHKLALGFFLGGFSTLLFMYIFTGGCGMFVNT